MTPASIQERKLELIQWLAVIEDVSLLEKLADLKRENDRDWWDDISDGERESIDVGIEQADSGNVKPHAEVRKLYDKWL